MKEWTNPDPRGGFVFEFLPQTYPGKGVDHTTYSSCPGSVVNPAMLMLMFQGLQWYMNTP